MEDFVRDRPPPVEFQQREQVGEPVTGPIVEFKPNGGDCVDKIDAGDPCLELGRWTVLVIPGKELLDGAGEEVGTDITENRRVLVEGGFHVVAPAGFGPIDVALDDLRDRVVLAHDFRCTAHSSYSSFSVVCFLVDDRLNLDHAAVSDEVGSCEVTRIVGGEKRHGSGDFLGLARPAERSLLDDLRSERVDFVLA
jgi:hypothetical protein